MTDQPYRSAAETNAAFAAHVNAGKVAAFEALGIDLIMGERSGSHFTHAFDGRRFLNCHCNGGVFNLGHRNPLVISALRSALDHLDIGNHPSVLDLGIDFCQPAGFSILRTLDTDRRIRLE